MRDFLLSFCLSFFLFFKFHRQKFLFYFELSFLSAASAIISINNNNTVLSDVNAEVWELLLHHSLTKHKKKRVIRQLASRQKTK